GKHRRFAHFVHVGAVRVRARLALEEVDEHWRPVRADEVEHQRRLVGIARLGIAVQVIFSHGGPLFGSWRMAISEWRMAKRVSKQIYSLLAIRLSRERHRLPGRRLAFEPARGR